MCLLAKTIMLLAMLDFSIVTPDWEMNEKIGQLQPIPTYNCFLRGHDDCYVPGTNT